MYVWMVLMVLAVMNQSDMLNIFSSVSGNSFSGKWRAIYFHYEVALHHRFWTQKERGKHSSMLTAEGKYIYKSSQILKPKNIASLFLHWAACWTKRVPYLASEGFIARAKSVFIFRYPEPTQRLLAVLTSEHQILLSVRNLFFFE